MVSCRVFALLTVLLIQLQTVTSTSTHVLVKFNGGTITLNRSLFCLFQKPSLHQDLNDYEEESKFECNFSLADFISLLQYFLSIHHLSFLCPYLVYYNTPHCVQKICTIVSKDSLIQTFVRNQIQLPSQEYLLASSITCHCTLLLGWLQSNWLFPIYDMDSQLQSKMTHVEIKNGWNGWGTMENTMLSWDNYFANYEHLRNGFCNGCFGEMQIWKYCDYCKKESNASSNLPSNQNRSNATGSRMKNVQDNRKKENDFKQFISDSKSSHNTSNFTNCNENCPVPLRESNTYTPTDISHEKNEVLENENPTENPTSICTCSHKCQPIPFINNNNYEFVFMDEDEVGRICNYFRKRSESHRITSEHFFLFPLAHCSKNQFIFPRCTSSNPFYFLCKYSERENALPICFKFNRIIGLIQQLHGIGKCVGAFQISDTIIRMALVKNQSMRERLIVILSFKYPPRVCQKFVSEDDLVMDWNNFSAYVRSLMELADSFRVQINRERIESILSYNLAEFRNRRKVLEMKLMSESE